ncbi:MAG: M28 family peptidase [Bacteroidota bacterium]
MGQPGQFKNRVQLIIVVTISIFIVSCGNETEQPKETLPKTPEVKKIATPDFNSDSAYTYIKAQVDFGPRVPGTPSHTKCADYLVAKLKSFGFEVMVQKGTVQTHDKKQFTLKNIIASLKPETQSRILLCSHWDTRPITEKDTKNTDKPGDGANDGASGAGVALEIARQTSILKPNIGIDIIFFDLEDYGLNGDSGNGPSTWCLGSQYWAKNLHTPNYYANFGILMDMVGGKDAVFAKEGISVEYASAIVEKVWKTANDIGYGNYFLPQTKYFVGEDDHIYVNQAGIPCIDIIEYNQASGAFADYHHTHKDNMDAVDKKTLKAVGQTVLEVIYLEK